MTEDKIYLKAPSGGLEPVLRRDFDSEKLLQELLATHPELLSGDQINPERPVRWLLVTREAGIPSEEGAADRWSMDHLLLDQDAIPTLVEVKRSTDTRTRRRVVGQLLDYAANAHKYWPADRIRSLATEHYGGQGAADEAVIELLDSGNATAEEVEQFWNQVEENMEQGRMRLLFVADDLPTELNRIIHFLNRHTQDYLEVLGVQVRYYQAGELEAFVPVVVGHSELTTDKRKSSPGSRRPITLSGLREKTSEEAFALFAAILDHAESLGLSISMSPMGFNVAPPSEGTRKTILYAFHQGARGREHDSLEAYTKHIPEELKDLAHERFSSVPQVQQGESSDYTYLLLLNEQGLEAGERLWEAVVEILESEVAPAAEPDHEPAPNEESSPEIEGDHSGREPGHKEEA